MLVIAPPLLAGAMISRTLISARAGMAVRVQADSRGRRDQMSNDTNSSAPHNVLSLEDCCTF